MESGTTPLGPRPAHRCAGPYRGANRPPPQRLPHEPRSPGSDAIAGKAHRPSAVTTATGSSTVVTERRPVRESCGEAKPPTGDLDRNKSPDVRCRYALGTHRSRAAKHEGGCRRRLG